MATDSKSGKALLDAIAGFEGEHAGSSQHESIIEQLRRVRADIHRGTAAAQDSPGRRAVADAAGRHESEMPSEREHDGGLGQHASNRPGAEAEHRPEEHPVIHEGDGRDDKLTGGVVPRSANKVAVFAPQGHPFEHGSAVDRRFAAMAKAEPRQMHGKPFGDDNTKSLPAGEGYPPADRVGHADHPAAKPSGGKGEGPSDAKGAKSGYGAGQPEPPPSFAGEGVGDPFSRLRERAKQAFREKRQS